VQGQPADPICHHRHGRQHRVALFFVNDACMRTNGMRYRMNSQSVPADQPLPPVALIDYGPGALHLLHLLRTPIYRLHDCSPGNCLLIASANLPFTRFDPVTPRRWWKIMLRSIRVLSSYVSVGPDASWLGSWIMRRSLALERRLSGVVADTRSQEVAQIGYDMKPARSCGPKAA